jgi:NADH dehydrogenase FAD-containing subunit
MGKHLLLLGAGHAHLSILKSISAIVAKGHAVTVVSPEEYQYYSGMGPGMLGGFFAPEHIRIPVSRLTKKGGGAFVLDHVARLLPAERAVMLQSGQRIEYDVASCNLGSVVPLPQASAFTKDGIVFPVKPISNLMKARRLVLGLAHRGQSRILVAGGGPAAVEIAGNAWRAARQCIEAKGGRQPEITILAGHGLLRGHPEKLALFARKNLEARDITIVENGYVTSIEDGRATLENGKQYQGDCVFMALGAKPPELFKESGMALGPGGGMPVNKYLQCVDHPELFGGGDCIDFLEKPLVRLGVFAVRQNPVLRHNLMAALNGGDLRAFEPQSKYMLICNMGDGTGLLWRDRFVCMNRPALWLKNAIDKRFVAKHQA